MMQRFRLIRHEDKTGVSGTGVVAEGVEFNDGVVALRWFGPTPSTVIHESIDNVAKIHGHGGATVIDWMDS